jgi:hypothetical protein
MVGSVRFGSGWVGFELVLVLGFVGLGWFGLVYLVGLTTLSVTDQISSNGF